jgi:5-formyltetrahydrofolate cyclo-ligase
MLARRSSVALAMTNNPTEPETLLRFAVKKELRKRMRGVRATLPAAAIEQRSAAIVQRLLALDVYREAATVALFWPIEGKNEVDLRPLCGPALAAGKRLALPWADVEANEIRLRAFAGPGELVAGPMGFDEPPASSPLLGAGDVELVIVPALAVDPSGHRIGYGKGYYDRLLASLAPAAVAVVVAFDFQLLVEVPATPGDFAVQLVVTDTRSFRAGEPVPRAERAPADPGAPGAGSPDAGSPDKGASSWKHSGPRSGG